jgi:nitrite reductase/ring-hydroxylating ferredoxin subunit
MTVTEPDRFNGIFATPLDELLDKVETSISDRLVPAEIFNSEEIFQAEMERIFTRVWVFVAHESEIPKAGDFVQRRIGLDPVIVTRDGTGGINVLSNYCRHRGTQVCQTDAGNSRFFTCPYHGWTYSNDGTLVGTPLRQRAYGELPDPKLWSLKKAPKVASYNGFIFASLSEDVPSLEEWLSGGASWMLDIITKLHPDGMRVAGPPDRYIVNGDWKTAAENFAGDSYHVPTLHGSVMEVGLIEGLQNGLEIQGTYEFANGHTFIGHRFGVFVPGFSYAGYSSLPGVVEKFDLSGYDETAKWVAETQPPTVGTIFPNLSFIRIWNPVPGGRPAVFTSFRQWQPVAPGKIELWSWQFVWNFQDQESVDYDAIGGQFCFGSGGVYEQDDTVAWEGIPRAAASPWMRKEDLKFHYQQEGATTGVDQSPDPDWKGPGIHRKTGYGEHAQFNFLRQWLKQMKAGAPESGCPVGKTSTVGGGH